MKGNKKVTGCACFLPILGGGVYVDLPKIVVYTDIIMY
jgi:hypothetical protein